MSGVDVDSKLRVCKIRRSGKDYPVAEFDNSPAGHRQFIRGATNTINLPESSWRRPAFIPYCSRSIEVMVANPKVIKNVATASLQRGKTDAMDAKTLLAFLERMPFRIGQPPTEDVLETQHISRRIVQLNKGLTRECNRHAAAKKLGAIGRVVANDTQVNMRHIERRINIMETSLLDLINAMPEFHHPLNLVTTVTGIANKTGPRIIAELATLPNDMTGPQCVAYTGLDPRPLESGTSTINRIFPP